MSGTTARGPRVLVSAPSGRVAELGGAVRGLGAVVIEAPVVSTAPLEDASGLDAAIDPPTPYDWVVFTSARGVEAVAARLAALGRPPSAVAARTAAVGPATAAAARAAGFDVAAVPGRFLTDAVAGALGDVRGQRVLLPRADRARESLAHALAAGGATVVSVDAYRTVPVDLDLPPPVAEAADMVAFTSASGVEFLASAVGPESWRRLTSHATACCIGPVTAAAAEGAGFARVRVADPHTADGLLRLLAEEVGSRG